MKLGATIGLAYRAIALERHARHGTIPFSWQRRARGRLALDNRDTLWAVVGMRRAVTRNRGRGRPPLRVLISVRRRFSREPIRGGPR